MTAERHNRGELRRFLQQLRRAGDLLEVSEPVSLVHEMTEVHRRVLAENGPALLFLRPKQADGSISRIPVLTNLFGARRRVEAALGCHEGFTPRDIGTWLGGLRQPEPVADMSDMIGRLPVLGAALAMRARRTKTAPVQEKVYKGQAVNLHALPIQTFWPGEAGPLISFPVVVTCAPGGQDDINTYNLGIYRMQVTGRNSLIARWLPQRGGARHHRAWQQEGKDMPVAAVIGADPASILAAVTPVPDTVSEYGFSGLLRKAPTELVRCKTVPLLVPAKAEIVIEGWVSKDARAPEGPFGDHTGYLNSVEAFPVFQVTAVTMRENPLWLSTYLSRPPDEASTMAETLNDVFLPLLQQQFPEIVDCWLPPEACSYRIAVISIKKAYPGQARRVMMAMWSYLYQFSYTKMIIVVDHDINARSWADVLWALSTRMDPSRDVCLLENTPVDYLDFASPASGLGGKIGFDATNKIGSETQRVWGRRLDMPDAVMQRVDLLWDKLGLERKAA